MDLLLLSLIFVCVNWSRPLIVPFFTVQLLLEDSFGATEQKITVGIM